MTPGRIAALTCVALVLFDAASALGSRAFGFAYEALWPVFPLACAGCAFVAARRAGSARAGLLAGLAVGATEATLGWGVASVILPGSQGLEDDGAVLVAAVALVVAVSGAVIGLLAGLAAQRRGPLLAGPRS